jgi:hypothetical protein
MAVARRLSELGIKVSNRAAAWSLPSWREWPGTLYLLGSQCDTDLELPKKRFAFIGGRSVRQQAILEAISRAA